MHSVHIIAAEPTVRVQYVNLHADFAKNSAAVGRRGGARLKAKPRKHYPVADTWQYVGDKIQWMTPSPEPSGTLCATLSETFFSPKPLAGSLL